MKTRLLKGRVGKTDQSAILEMRFKPNLPVYKTIMFSQ